MPANATRAATASVTISVPYCFQNCFSSAICSCSSRSNAMSESSVVVESRVVRLEDHCRGLFRIDLHLFPGFPHRLDRDDLPIRLFVANDHGEAGTARVGAVHLRF